MADAPFSRGAVQRLLLIFKSPRAQVGRFGEAVGRLRVDQIVFKAVKRPVLISSFSFHRAFQIKRRPDLAGRDRLLV